VMDGPIKEPTGNPDAPFYEPNNYSGNFYGAVSVRTALANSFNIPAVKAIRYTGVEHVMDVARRMGLKESFTQDASFYGLSLALGAGEVQLLEHTNAYATFANNGAYVAANPILKIEDGQGNVLYDVERDKPWEQATQAIKAEYAYQITSILTDNEARAQIFTENNLFGNTQQELGRPTAAKSGTTDNWRDIWTMGYTSDLAVGVWVGNTSAGGDSPAALPELDGIQGAGPIWQRMMIEMHNNPEWSKYLLGPNGRALPEAFPRPDGIYEGEVCSATGGKPVSGFDTTEEVLVRGEGPSLRCDQMSAYDAEELEDALDDIRSGAPYVGSGVDRVERYADAVNGFNTGGFSNNTRIVSTNDDDNQDSFESGVIEENSSLDEESDTGNSPPIVSTDD
ncbi:MAG: hypothetical protein IT336_16235, partial [Thermomicrobiales bacterium]|nr:hypothetical protein [Thermomicrobiales bacterium]